MKHLLREAAREIRSLRQRNEILSAKVEVIETIGLIARGCTGHQNHPMGVDVAWRLDQQVAELEAAEKAASSEAI